MRKYESIVNMGVQQNNIGDKRMKYKVHQFDIKMASDQNRFEQFLNSLKGEVVAIIPNITIMAFWIPHVNFLLIVEKIAEQIEN